MNYHFRVMFSGALLYITTCNWLLTNYRVSGSIHRGIVITKFGQKHLLFADMHNARHICSFVLLLGKSSELMGEFCVRNTDNRVVDQTKLTW